MNFDSENPFNPLINFVKDEGYEFNETMGQFMYMYDDDDIYYYKDKNNRKYLKLDSDGRRVGGRW